MRETPPSDYFLGGGSTDSCQDQLWIDGELQFNALVQVTGTRMWGVAKELTVEMRRSKKDSEVTWDTVELLIPRAQFTVQFRDDGTPLPNLTEEPDPDDLYSEEYLTKQFWKSRYDAYNRIYSENAL